MMSRRLLRVGLLAAAVNALTVSAFASDPQPKADAWVAAATAPPAPAPVADAPTRSPWRYAAIAAVLGVVGFFAYRSRQRGAGKQLPALGKLALLDSLRIGPQAHLVVVSVAGRTLLLSVTGTSVRRLAPLDGWLKPEAAESVPAANDEPTDRAVSTGGAEAQTAPPSFGHMLRRFVTNLEGRNVSDPAVQIAEATSDRVDLRSRPTPRSTPADEPRPAVAPPPGAAPRAVRKVRAEESATGRKAPVVVANSGVENQVSGLIARRSARGA